MPRPRRGYASGPPGHPKRSAGAGLTDRPAQRAAQARAEGPGPCLNRPGGGGHGRGEAPGGSDVDGSGLGASSGSRQLAGSRCGRKGEEGVRSAACHPAGDPARDRRPLPGPRQAGSAPSSISVLDAHFCA